MLTSCVYDGELTTFGWLLIIAMVLFIIFAVYGAIESEEAKQKYEKKRAELKKKKEEEEAAKKLEEEKKKQQYDEQVTLLNTEVGVPDKTIIIEPLDINKEIRAYSSLEKVTILGKDYDFASILSCTFTDDSWVEKGETTLTSTGSAKTDNGNMLGRAIVGGVVAGGAGAVIGGSTAKKNTQSTSVVQQGKDTLHHNYTVLISVKDIANPLIRIPLGKKGNVVNDIVALMNAIIASKH